MGSGTETRRGKVLLIWVIAEHFLKGRVAIKITEDDDIEKVKKNILLNMDVVDVAVTDDSMRKEWFGES